MVPVVEQLVDICLACGYTPSTTHLYLLCSSCLVTVICRFIGTSFGFWLQRTDFWASFDMIILRRMRLGYWVSESLLVYLVYDLMSSRWICTSHFRMISLSFVPLVTVALYIASYMATIGHLIKG